MKYKTLQQAQEKRLLRHRMYTLLARLREKRAKRQVLWDLLQELRRRREVAGSAECARLWEEQNRLWQSISEISQEQELLLKQFMLRQGQLKGVRRVTIDRIMHSDRRRFRYSKNEI